LNGKRFQAALKHGYRSGLEMKISDYLKELDIPVVYEAIKIEWEDLMYRTYTPDFVLPNGIIIESKGRFTAADRRKHIEIKKQHPKLDIRFVFYNSRNKLNKGAKTTYQGWCEKHKFLYYDRIVPLEWIQEKGKNKHKPLIHLPYKKIVRR